MNWGIPVSAWRKEGSRSVLPVDGLLSHFTCLLLGQNGTAIDVKDKQSTKGRLALEII